MPRHMFGGDDACEGLFEARQTFTSVSLRFGSIRVPLYAILDQLGGVLCSLSNLCLAAGFRQIEARTYSNVTADDGLDSLHERLEVRLDSCQENCASPVLCA